MNKDKNLNINIDIEKYKLWIWDFDGTLIKYSTYNKIPFPLTDSFVISNDLLTECFPNWRDFRDLVVYLRRNNKCIGIASFGTYAFIYALMRRIFGREQKYFTDANIITPYERNNIPRNKNNYIKRLMNIYGIRSVEDVIFFDDNDLNIRDAETMGVVSVKIGPYMGGCGGHNIHDGDKLNYFGLHSLGYYYTNNNNSYKILFFIMFFLIIYGVFIM